MQKIPDRLQHRKCVATQQILCFDTRCRAPVSKHAPFNYRQLEASISPTVLVPYGCRGGYLDAVQIRRAFNPWRCFTVHKGRVIAILASCHMLGLLSHTRNI